MAKYIRFDRNPLELCQGKPEWFVCSKRTGKPLGHMVWYDAWHQWIFETAPETIWSYDCLNDVQQALIRLNKGEQP